MQCPEKEPHTERGVRRELRVLMVLVAVAMVLAVAACGLVGPQLDLPDVRCELSSNKRPPQVQLLPSTPPPASSSVPPSLPAAPSSDVLGPK